MNYIISIKHEQGENDMKVLQVNSSFDSMEGLTSKVAVACPISGERLDERAVRLVAWITVTLLAVYLITGWSVIPWFLLIDFSMRGVFSRKWAPLAIIGRGVVSRLDSSKKKLINAAPKIFAARLGIAFSAILTILLVAGLGQSTATYIVGGIFLTAALLEAAFAFCLGCHIYQFIQRLKQVGFRNGEGI
jgi:hypothetical protein